MSDSKDVVNWTEMMAQEAKAVAVAERPTSGKISMQGGELSLDGNAIAGNTMDCVILAMAHEQVLYTERWQPNKIVPPVCFAVSPSPAEAGVMAPSSDVPEPFAEFCAACDKRSFGDGGEKPECQSRRRIALAPWNDGDSLDDGTYTMTFPSYSSGKELSTYVNRVTMDHMRPPYGVITRIKLLPHPKWQYRLEFTCLGLIGEDQLGKVFSRLKKANEQLLIGYDLTIAEEVPAKKLKGTK